jgi:hypothetical protein
MKYGAMTLLVGLLSLTGFAGAHAASLIDYVGSSYELGGFPPSSAGDNLSFVALVDGLSAPLSWDPANYQYTIHISSLTSLGEQHPDPNNVIVEYSGGAFDLYEDSQFNADPGVNPPNDTSPATYIDGGLYLAGNMSHFVIYYNTQYQSGAFEADVTFTHGSDFQDLGNQTTGYTFGGVFLFGAPQGYDLQWDGQILLDPVAVEASTWGGVKNAFLH